MADDAKPQSWWQTLPGILTSATAAITAIAGLIAVVHQLSGGSPANPQPTAVASPQAQVTMAPAAVASAVNGAATSDAARQVPTGRFANHCGCWGTIKYGSTHPDLRCQSGLAVARKCVEMCPKGYNAWHYECE